MALPESQQRKLAHTRSRDYRGYQREDGLRDIEAHMTDTKTFVFKNNWRGEIKAWEPFHEMLLRLTIDDDFVIKDIIASTEHSPFEMCPDLSLIHI